MGTVFIVILVVLILAGIGLVSLFSAPLTTWLGSEMMLPSPRPRRTVRNRAEAGGRGALLADPAVRSGSPTAVAW
jgi:uncharacterized iron-regulated membrane protein